MNLLSYLLNILEVINLLNTRGTDARYAEHDVRRTFFAKAANALRVYYLGMDSVFIVSKLSVVGSYPIEEVPHIENFGWIMPKESNAKFLDTYHSMLKLNLLNGSWVSFESSLDELYQAMISGDDREHIELKDYYEVAKLLRNLTIDQNLDRQLRKRLRNKHVPINDKYNAIFKLGYLDDRDVKQDRVFLEFFGSCRNCMHNNSISSKDAHFETRFGGFDFHKGNHINFMTPDLIIKIVGELSEIYWAFCSSIDHKDVIVDPYPVQVGDIEPANAAP